MTTPTRENLLQIFLASRDVNCPSCGYNMRGSATSTCPECGQKLTLGLHRRETTTRTDAWWLAGVFGLAVALLITIVTVLPLLSPVTALLQQPSRAQLVAAGMVSQSEMPDWWLLLRMAVVTTTLTAWLGWMLLVRRRLVSAPAWRRILLILITATAPVWIIGVLSALARL